MHVSYLKFTRWNDKTFHQDCPSTMPYFPLEVDKHGFIKMPYCTTNILGQKAEHLPAVKWVYSFVKKVKQFFLAICQEQTKTDVKYVHHK